MTTIKRPLPRDGHPVLLSEAVVRGLRQIVIDGLTALPRRGMEVGGLLFGMEDAEEVRIEGFEEVTCEHRYGPAYALSNADKANLHDLLAAWPADKPHVIGFFRSFTSRDPVIEDADEAFVREHFPAGRFVYLMLQPLSVENCVASFRSFQDGRLLPDDEEAAWPFGLAEHTPKPPSAAPEPAPFLVTRSQFERVPSLPPALTRHRLGEERTSAPPQRTRWWVPALVCLVSVATGAVISHVTNGTRAAAGEPRGADLHMDARPLHGRLEVKWDAIPQATRGRLEVVDGDARREIELNAGQLRSGTFSYEPSKDDIRLRLSLYAKGSEIAGDSVRIKSIPELTIRPESNASNGAKVPPSPPAPRAEQPSVAAPAQTPQVAVVPSELYRVQPQIPAGIRSRMAAPVIIPVAVQVSERGLVVRASAERSGIDDSVHRYLADQAQKAAWKWRFRPAQSASGERVAASKTLRFVFTP